MSFTFNQFNASLLNKNINNKTCKILTHPKILNGSVITLKTEYSFKWHHNMTETQGWRYEIEISIYRIMYETNLYPQFYTWGISV